MLNVMKRLPNKVAIGDKAHQRVIREKAAETEVVPKNIRELAKSFDNARVERIDNAEAAAIILRYEWLGNLGNSRVAYGLFFGDYLAGAVCFGDTAGTNVKTSVCGSEHAHRVITLVRGACAPWADQVRVGKDARIHTGAAASFLISAACRKMAEQGKNIIIAYSDTDAGEVGTVYQACNWLYCGKGAGSDNWVHPDGRVVNARQITGFTRVRVGRPSKPRKPGADLTEFRRRLREWEEIQKSHGYEVKGEGTDYPYVQDRRRDQITDELECDGFVRQRGNAKGRYVGLYGDRATVRQLRKALRWPIEPYPKRPSKQ